LYGFCADERLEYVISISEGAIGERNTDLCLREAES